MLLLLLFVLLAAVGFVLVRIYDSPSVGDWTLMLGVLLSTIFTIVTLTAGIGAIVANINPEYRYEQDMVEYDTLVYEEENGYITFAQDVIEYNHKVNAYRQWANNPWTNWFYYDGCENLPYYEITK